MTERFIVKYDAFVTVTEGYNRAGFTGYRPRSQVFDTLEEFNEWLERHRNGNETVIKSIERVTVVEKLDVTQELRRAEKRSVIKRKERDLREALAEREALDKRIKELSS
jgi:succinate dehydrogenase/fumarate reductase flavoprotein subunit